ncbi:MAG TPA: T9SS type A sorting domain-containing protein [Bacteroidetes bacterium]|nr:T9SS type A sorting domain-containing protein [Bacteroidota bacterium]
MHTGTPLRSFALLLAAAFVLVLSPDAVAQSPLAVAPGPSTLNDAIENDTNRPADRVYVLQREAYYGVSREINNQGYTLRIAAAEGEGNRPVIYRSFDENGNSPGSRYFNLAGDAEFTGIYFLNADPNQGEAATVFALNNAGMRFVVDDCVFQGGRSRLIEVNVDDSKLFFSDSQFRNLVRNDGSSNGRPIDFRTVRVDSLVIENTSFLNVSGYILRYDGPALNHVVINHNTFYTTGRELMTNAFATQVINYEFTNNLVVDPHFYGQPPVEDGVLPQGVVPLDSLDAGIDNGYTESDRTLRIENNGYMITDDLQAFYDARTASGDPIDPRALLDNGLQLYAAANPSVALSNNETYDLEFVAPPDLSDLITYLGNYRDGLPEPGSWLFGEEDGALFPATQPPPEDLAYDTSSPAYTASTLGFPLGDLNYFPDEKAQWEAIVTSADEGPDASAFGVVRAYPNPTTGAFSLRFDLEEPARLAVRVFDALGRRVLDSEERTLAAGASQEVRVDGASLAPGVYLARLTADVGGESRVRTVRLTVAR